MTDAAVRFGVELAPRARQIVVEARVMLEEVGWEAVSMRPLAERLGMRGPSLYKHFSGREQIKSALIAEGLLEMGETLHAVLDGGGSLAEMLASYRAASSSPVTRKNGDPAHSSRPSGRLSRSSAPAVVNRYRWGLRTPAAR